MSSRHSFQLCKELQQHLEASRFRGRSAGVRGIVEENDRIVDREGFSLPAGAWQVVPKPGQAEVVQAEMECTATFSTPFRFPVTQVCVANVDTLTAAITLGDAAALNFANAETPGGRYRCGAMAQEEDLCRLLPQLYPALLNSNSYPIEPGTAIITRNLLAVRRPGTYELVESLGQCCILTAAMPCGMADIRPKGGWLGSPWAATVSLRIRASLTAAKATGHANLILGAFGCGAFGNPAGPVAAIFRQQLAQPAFRGYFENVVFAIIDPMGTGNLRPFREEFAKLDQSWVEVDSEPCRAPREES